MFESNKGVTDRINNYALLYASVRRRNGTEPIIIQMRSYSWLFSLFFRPAKEGIAFVEDGKLNAKKKANK